VTEIVGFWKEQVCSDLRLYEGPVQVGLKRKKKRKKSDKERIATSGL
jgi:hypothetical protein